MNVDAASGDRAPGWIGRIGRRLRLHTARHPYIQVTYLLFGMTAAALGIWLLAGPRYVPEFGNHLIAHAFLETCSIVVSLMVFIAACTSSNEQRSRSMALIGIAFLGVGLFDFLHAQSYPGMPAFVTPSSPEKAFAFRSAARLLAAIALLAAAWLDWRRTVPGRWLAVATVAMLAGVAAVSAAILYPAHLMPSAFPTGSATWQITMHLVIIAINLAAAAGFLRMLVSPQSLPTATVNRRAVALMCAAAALAMSEVFMIFYMRSASAFNVIGHVFTVIAAWFIYRGLVATSLFEIETRARLALEGARLGAWSWVPATDVLELDRTAASLWGLPTSTVTTMTTVAALVHPDDQEERRTAISKALDPKGSGIYVAEFRIVAGDGALRHVVSRAATEFRSGSPMRLIGVVRDDTQRRRRLDAERQSESRLSGIMSIAADAIISIDEGGRIDLFNQGAEKIFGYKAREIIGQPLDTLIPPRFRNVHGGHIRRFGASGVTAQRMGERQEVAGLRKDGTEFPAEASISKLVIDGVTTFNVVLRDVTDRKQLEIELERRVAERTAELSALLDAVPDGIVQKDSTHHIRVPNAAMSRLFGLSREEMIGKPARILLARPADEENVLRAWTGLDSGRPFETVTVECRRKDGSTFTAMIRGSAVRDDHGRVVSRVAMIRDVTEELRRQTALNAAQRMEAFGQLTGGIAHDFNNLLTVISGNQELLEMRLKDERDLALLKRAQTAAEMGARLTSRLLTFARRRQLSDALISLNEQIMQMVDLLRRSIGEQITLTTNLSPRLPLVKADPSEIENAVLNLAINARDAMPNGGTIVIETSEHIVGEGEPADEANLEPGRYVRLSVTDTGEGMSPAVASRAFEPFYSTKPHGKGTGLGLSTIHGFAEQSGGGVTLHSEPGQGTTVSIYLPSASDESAATATTIGEETVPIAAGENVLLVEDNPEVRRIARMLLEGLGYRVDEAGSGAAAIERLTARPGVWDLVFCDVVMPGGYSGFDVARWIRANAPQTRVLLTSGFPDEVATGGGNDNGEARFDTHLLRKPYSRMELARNLRQILDA